MHFLCSEVLVYFRFHVTGTSGQKTLVVERELQCSFVDGINAVGPCLHLKILSTISVINGRNKISQKAFQNSVTGNENVHEKKVNNPPEKCFKSN